jgi:hypothetical protein
MLNEPYLKEQLRNPKAKLHNETSTLQIGLAKAGQVQQLQQISCELNFGDSSARFDAMRKVESVGGWFAISNMAEFLKNDPRYTSAFGGVYESCSGTQRSTEKLVDGNLSYRDVVRRDGKEPRCE